MGSGFGRPYPQLHSAKQGVDRYLVAGTCIGLEIATGEVYAPYRAGGCGAGILGLTHYTRSRNLFARKARSYQVRWPWLEDCGAGLSTVQSIFVWLIEFICGGLSH